MPNYGPCPKCNPIEQITITNVITHTFTALGLILLQIGSEIGEGEFRVEFRFYNIVLWFCFNFAKKYSSFRNSVEEGGFRMPPI